MSKEKRKLITLPLSEIKPYENNPRRISEEAVSAVAESIRQTGYNSPIIVGEDHVILAGHTRLLALQELGYTEAQCLVISGLTEEQQRKYRILDNKLGELSEWDETLLQEELSVLNLDGFRWFDEPTPIEATGPKEEETPEDKDIRCPRCGALVEKYEET